MDCTIKSQSVNKIISHFCVHLLALLEPKSGEKKEGGESKSTDTMKNDKETGSKDPKPKKSLNQAKNVGGKKEKKPKGKNEVGRQSSESQDAMPKGSPGESNADSSEEKGEKKKDSSEEGKRTSLFHTYRETAIFRFPPSKSSCREMVG